LPPDLLGKVSVLTPNETEAVQILGADPDGRDDEDPGRLGDINALATGLLGSASTPPW
jgi:hypothetical protein